MARAGTGIVVAELNVQAPVKPVFHFPMASHGVHEFLGIGGNAADVVTPLDAGLLTDGAGALDHGKALQIAPLLALVEPIVGFEGPATPPLLPAMPAVAALPRIGVLTA